MKANVDISEDVLERIVKTTEVEQWVSSLLKKFHKNEDSKQYYFLKKGIVKEIVDELIPLSKYSMHAYNDASVFLKFYSGSKQSFDAEFIDTNNNLIERVEVTMAIDGQVKTIQAEHLIKYSYAPVYKTPDFTGKVKGRVIIEHESGCVDSITIIKEQAALLQNSYNKKQENIHKYPNTTLLIGLDI